MPGIWIHGRCHDATRPHNLPAWSTCVWLLGQEGAGVGGHELPGGQWPSGAWGCPAVTLPVPSWPKWVVARPHPWAGRTCASPLVGLPRAGRDPCVALSAARVCPPRSPPAQYIDAISNKQGELENYVSDGYKTALTEERRRFCFLVEKQCAVAKNSAAYHSKVRSAGRGPSCPWWPSGACPLLSCVERNTVHFRFPRGQRSSRRVTGPDAADVSETLVRNC